jgi:Protein of unknown function DUF262
MNNFRINRPDRFSLITSFHQRETFWMDPPYQREGDLWPLEKRQLLIDSLLNGFDVPKIYLHEFYPSKQVGAKEYEYAVIDGKQRLSTIWQFCDNQWALAEDFIYMQDPNVKLANLTFRELGEQFPVIRDMFNGIPLPIVSIVTPDVDVIEDMFSRLNDGVPLSAPEKRNTFGGPAPKAIRALSKHVFFKKKLPFGNRRYRHFDLAAKFLYFENNGGQPKDTKKRYLDDFVEDCKKRKAASVTYLQHRVVNVLDRMTAIFTAKDDLLKSAGMVTLYYLLLSKDAPPKLKRHRLVAFEQAREENRLKAEADLKKANYELIEFDSFTQSPNDEIAMQYRLQVLRKHLGLANPK